MPFLFQRMVFCISYRLLERNSKLFDYIRILFLSNDSSKKKKKHFFFQMNENKNKNKQTKRKLS